MIVNKPFDRTAQNAPYSETLGSSCLTELFLIVAGYAPYKAYRQIRTAIRNNISAEEVAEIIDNQLMDLRHVSITADEGRQ